MNRRNFVVGLGTVATISGVASVTAASFADSVTAQSDFQVIVDENLTLELGDGVPEDETELESESGWTDTSLSFDDQDIDFDSDDADGGVIAYTDLDAGDGEDDPINDEILLEVAVVNDPDVVNDTTYDEFLNVQNEGVNDQEVGIIYEFGEDVDESTVGDADGGSSEGEIDAADVVDLFVFEESGGDQISPDDEADGVDEPQPFTAEPGPNQIDFIVNLEGDLADEFAEEADVEDSLFSNDDGASDNFDLIDSIEVGVIEDGGGT